MFKYQKWVSDWRWFHVAEKKEKMERKPKNKIKGQHPYGRKKDDEKWEYGHSRSKTVEEDETKNGFFSVICWVFLRCGCCFFFIFIWRLADRSDREPAALGNVSPPLVAALFWFFLPTKQVNEMGDMRKTTTTTATATTTTLVLIWFFNQREEIQDEIVDGHHWMWRITPTLTWKKNGTNKVKKVKKLRRRASFSSGRRALMAASKPKTRNKKKIYKDKRKSTPVDTVTRFPLESPRKDRGLAKKKLKKNRWFRHFTEFYWVATIDGNPRNDVIIER